MASPLEYFCYRLNSPATAADYLIGFVVLALMLTIEATFITSSSGLGVDQFVNQWIIEMHQPR